MIDIIETVYRGARKGRGLVILRKIIPQNIDTKNKRLFNKSILKIILNHIEIVIGLKIKYTPLN